MSDKHTHDQGLSNKLSLFMLEKEGEMLSCDDLITALREHHTRAVTDSPQTICDWAVENNDKECRIVEFEIRIRDHMNPEHFDC